MEAKSVAELVIDGRMASLTQTENILEQLYKARSEIAMLTKTVGEIKAVLMAVHGLKDA